MTPQHQFAESVKYIARPVIIIPTDDSFVIMEAYGTRREHICTIKSEELVQWIKDDFLSRRDNTRKPSIDLLVDLDMIELDLDNLLE